MFFGHKEVLKFKEVNFISKNPSIPPNSVFWFCFPPGCVCAVGKDGILFHLSTKEAFMKGSTFPH